MDTLIQRLEITAEELDEKNLKPMAATVREAIKALSDHSSERQVDAKVSNQFEEFIIAKTFIKLEIGEPLKAETIIRRVLGKDHLTAMELFDENTKNLYQGYLELPLTIIRTYALIDC